MPAQAPAMTLPVRLQEAFKLALSLTLFYWLALWMDWDYPKYGALTIVVVSLATTGASLNKGVMRVAGTGLGALAGFVLLSLFAQSPGGMLLGVGLYLVVIGYFMQTSRQGDVWFNAGFIAVSVWSSSYMKIDTAFHFATGRFQETAAGVILFTLASVLFWPRTSGSALREQGQALWEGLRELFALYRCQLEEGSTPAAARALQMRLAGAWQQLQSTLTAAYADTAQVRRHKHAWELLRVDLQAFAGAQALWHESIADCQRLDLDRLLPGLAAVLDTLDARLAHGTALWRAQNGSGQTGSDAGLLAELDLAIDAEAAAALSHLQRGALLNFVAHLRTLERSSRELLLTLRVLAGLEPAGRLHALAPKADRFRPARWNPERLFKALFPAACWFSAWAFWFYVQPPGGTAIPLMGVSFGLIMLMAPMNLPGLLLVLLLSMFLVVAPVYMFVMPLLDSGFAILALIFLYAFCFGYLGTRSPVLKLGPLVMFVMMVDINNDQVYSFIKLLTGGLVMLLGVGIVVLVHRLLAPMHPEQILLRGLQRFFGGCAALFSAYTGYARRRHGALRGYRKRLFENRILPLPARLQHAAGNLDYARFPDNSEDKVEALLQALFTVRNRLLSLEAGFERAAAESPALLRELQPLHEDWLRRMRAVFEGWRQLGAVEPDGAGREDPRRLALDLERRLDELQRKQDAPPASDRGLQSLYALIGSVRALLEAMQALQERYTPMNWRQWAAPRF